LEYDGVWNGWIWNGILLNLSKLSFNLALKNFLKTTVLQLIPNIL
jgi:hypothetical protein